MAQYDLNTKYRRRDYTGDWDFGNLFVWLDVALVLFLSVLRLLGVEEFFLSDWIPLLAIPAQMLSLAAWRTLGTSEWIKGFLNYIWSEYDGKLRKKIWAFLYKIRFLFKAVGFLGFAAIYISFLPYIWDMILPFHLDYHPDRYADSTEWFHMWLLMFVLRQICVVLYSFGMSDEPQDLKNHAYYASDAYKEQQRRLRMDQAWADGRYYGWWHLCDGYNAVYPVQISVDECFALYERCGGVDLYTAMHDPNIRALCEIPGKADNPTLCSFYETNSKIIHNREQEEIRKAEEKAAWEEHCRVGLETFTRLREEDRRTHRYLTGSIDSWHIGNDMTRNYIPDCLIPYVWERMGKRNIFEIMDDPALREEFLNGEDWGVTRANKEGHMADIELLRGANYQWNKMVNATGAAPTFVSGSRGEAGEVKVDYVLNWWAKVNHAQLVKKDCQSQYSDNCIRLANWKAFKEAQEFDHLLVTPIGVIHIETKSYVGNIYVEDEDTWINQIAEHRVERMESPNAQVRRHEVVLKSIMPENIPVHSFICLANMNLAMVGAEKSSVPIATLRSLDRELTKYFNACPTRLSDAEMEQAMQLIESHKVRHAKRPAQQQ